MSTEPRITSSNCQYFLDIKFKSDAWKHLWSIKEYIQEMTHLIKNNGRFVGIELGSVAALISPGISFKFPVVSANTIIEEEVLKQAAVVRELHDLTEASLMTKLRGESVIMYFNFPEDVRVPCEQYLIYFVQFLKDIGVEATAELTYQAGQALFAVTPNNKHEALDKIRAALETYLSLPAGNLSGGESDIATQRLASNVYHLKSQLALARAVLQAQEATIQAQQVTIQKHRELGGEVVIESLKRVIPQPEAEDKEEMLGGTVAITKYKGKGFEVNLPEMFRRLRRFLVEEE